jgi:hypothetical protein
LGRLEKKAEKDAAAIAASDPGKDEMRATHPRIATCLVGALRTFAEPVVQESLALNLPPRDEKNDVRAHTPAPLASSMHTSIP